MHIIFRFWIRLRLWFWRRGSGMVRFWRADFRTLIHLFRRSSAASSAAHIDEIHFYDFLRRDHSRSKMKNQSQESKDSAVSRQRNAKGRPPFGFKFVHPITAPLLCVTQFGFRGNTDLIDAHRFQLIQDKDKGFMF